MYIKIQNVFIENINTECSGSKNMKDKNKLREKRKNWYFIVSGTFQSSKKHYMQFSKKKKKKALHATLCRSIHAMEGNVEIHSQALISPTSLLYGLRTGLLSE